MDMVYSYPDALSYSSLRHPSYSFSNDNNAWQWKEPKQDKRTTNDNKKNTPPCRDPKGSCPICLERQRRPLATYIQQKSREDRVKDTSILEEEEIDQESNKDTPANKQLEGKPQ